MLLAVHLAVTIPPGRKLPSSWEQGRFTCAFGSEVENMNVSGQADKVEGCEYYILLIGITCT